MIKKYTYIFFLYLLCVPQPSYSIVTNSLYVGGQGLFPLHQDYYSTFMSEFGGYLGIESRFNGTIALINTFSMGYQTNFTKPTNSAFNIIYTLGVRTFLGVDTVFLDFGTGFSYHHFLNGQIFHSQRENEIFNMLFLSLGFNIPINSRAKFQIILDLKFMPWGILVNESLIMGGAKIGFMFKV